MSYFSDLLTAYSKRIGINSPQIAGYCGLDRVTVYRFMKGKTLPKDRETVHRMPGILMAFRRFFGGFSKDEVYSEEESREILRMIAQGKM